MSVSTLVIEEEEIALRRSIKAAEAEFRAAQALTAEATAVVAATRAANLMAFSPEASLVSMGFSPRQGNFVRLQSDLMSAISAMDADRDVHTRATHEAATDLQLRQAASLSSQKCGTLELGTKARPAVPQPYANRFFAHHQLLLLPLLLLLAGGGHPGGEDARGRHHGR